MHRFASLFVVLVAVCAMAEPAPPLHQLAGRYVRLVLEIGAHEEGYIDAFYGPTEWKAEANAHPRSLAELSSEADMLGEQLSKQVDLAQDRLEHKRAAYLLANVRSARFRLDMIGGARIPFLDEAERLFAFRPELLPLQSYDPVLARIEALVPGPGPLSERVDVFMKQYEIPKDRLRSVLDAAIAECRARTRRYLALPANEHLDLEIVANQTWNAYNWYKGDNKSLIQVNTDLPISISAALVYGCHEGYPGHHVQGIYTERLYRERGWPEFSVVPLFAPGGPLSEGGAEFGIDLTFPGAERLAFETRTLYPLADLDPATAPAYYALRHEMKELAGAKLTILEMYLDGAIDRTRARELIQRYQLVSRDRAEEALNFADQYRSYVINYVSGEDLVRAFIERSGASEAERWAAYERIIAEPTLPNDLF